MNEIFNQALKNYRSFVIYDFETYGSTSYNPRIKGFKTYDCKNHFVQQKYILHSNLSMAKIKHKNILNYLLEELARKEHDFFPIVGDFGSGKSSILYKLLYQYCKHDTDSIVFYIPLGELTGKKIENDNVDTLLSNMSKFLINTYKLQANKDTFVSEAVKNPDKKCILLLDGLDEMLDILDKEKTQKQFNIISEISKYLNTKVVLTSRYSYIHDDLKTQLLNSNNLIEICDFERDDVENFLNLRFQTNYEEKKEVQDLLNSNTYLKNLVKKPLFLHMVSTDHKKICERCNFKYFNIATMFETFTENWFNFDLIKKQYLTGDVDAITKIIEERKKCTMAAAIAIHNTGKQSIEESDLSSEIQKEFPGVLPFDLSRYLRDSENCTFLERQSKDSFSFPIRSIQEYFIAKKVIEWIETKNVDQILDIAKKHVTEEVLKFIKYIIEDNWTIQNHVAQSLQIEINKDLFQKIIVKKIDHKTNIYEMLKIVKNRQILSNSSILIEILHITNNSLTNVDLKGLDLSGANLIGINLTGSDLTGTILHQSNLRNALLMQSNLVNTDFSNAVLINADLSESYLGRANMNNANLTRANLEKVFLKTSEESNSYVDTLDLSDAILKHSNLSGAVLTGANLQNANLSGANLLSTKLENANMIEVDLTRAYMHSVKMRFVKLMNADLSGAFLVRADLRNSNMEKTNLRGCDLREADLSESNLTKAQIKGAIFSEVKIRSADLTDASLERSSLRDTDLTTAKSLTRTNCKNSQGLQFSNELKRKGAIVDSSINS